MLAKPFRLPSYLIPEVLKKGKTLYSPLFVLRFCQGTTLHASKVVPLKISQFAFIVSKKLDKRATVRNKIKRRLSEAVRSLLPQVKGNYAVIILAKKEILKASFQEIKRTVLASLQGLSLNK